MLVFGLFGSSNLQGEHLLIALWEVWKVFQQKKDGWMDGWMDGRMDGWIYCGYWCCHHSRYYSMIFIKTLTLVREQLATLPVYFFLAYLAASLLNALDVGSSAG